MNSENVAQYVRTNQIVAEIVFLEQPTPTVEAAAEAVNASTDEIVKSVLFLIRDEEQRQNPLLVIANGMRRVDHGKLARHLGVGKKRVRLANADQVKAFTGFSVGTVPPFGHVQPLPTVIERQVVNQERIYAGGGAINALVFLSVDELRRVLRTDVIDLAMP